MALNLIPAEAFPPGEYLRDELEERGWTEKEFAEILGRPVQVVSEILNGRKQIVTDTALAIGEALGTSPELWLNLQTTFNLFEARSSRPSTTGVTRRARLRSRVPIAELRKRGWVPDTSDLDKLEPAVCDLLEVESLEDEPPFVVAAHRANPSEPFTPQQIAWLGRVRQLARQRVEKNGALRYDPKATDELSAGLAHRIHDPTDLSRLTSWLAECGVSLITELPLRTSKLDGAVTRLDPDHPVIGLTSRGDRMDIYLFTLLHELAHLTLGHLDRVGTFVDENLDLQGDSSAIEAAVNDRAGEWILPHDLVLPSTRPTMVSVLQMANRYRVHSSLVIGRLQHQLEDWSLLRSAIPRVRPFIEIAR